MTILGLSPIQYLEQRIAALRREQPTTRAGQIARDTAVSELEGCVQVLKAETLRVLRLVQAETERES